MCMKQPVDAHHVKTRGAGGSDIIENLMPLCRAHHSEIHAKGLMWASKNYSSVEYWLGRNGWEVDKFDKKWKRSFDERESKRKTTSEASGES